MLIEHYDPGVFTPSCAPGAERCPARALLLAGISEVLLVPIPALGLQD